jgi:hypothetical protein
MTESAHQETSTVLRDACFQEGYLDDQSKTKEIAMKMFLRNWNLGQYTDSSFRENVEASRVFIDGTQAIIDGNIRSIYEWSQSPIERMFLCSFLIHSVFLQPWRINITPPIDMTTYPDTYRERYHERERVYAL